MGQEVILIIRFEKCCGRWPNKFLDLVHTIGEISFFYLGKECGTSGMCSQLGLQGWAGASQKTDCVCTEAQRHAVIFRKQKKMVWLKFGTERSEAFLRNNKPRQNYERPCTIGPTEELFSRAVTLSDSCLRGFNRQWEMCAQRAQGKADRPAWDFATLSLFFKHPGA